MRDVETATILKLPKRSMREKNCLLRSNCSTMPKPCGIRSSLTRVERLQSSIRRLRCIIRLRIHRATDDIAARRYGSVGVVRDVA